MKWRGRRGSSNIEDRRGAGGRGGLGRMRMPRGRGARRAGGIGGLGAVAIILVGMFLGVDTSYLLGGGGVSGFQLPNQNASQPNAIDDDMEQFVSVVLADTEEVWSAIFAKELNRRYQPPKLVLFSGATRSACGSASSATGPFYCPGDRRAYLDTAFFSTLSRQLGAKGDFAQAYVIAHEIAHHVQNELGILAEVNRLRARASETESNQLSVRVELQADCLSGLWAREAQARFGSLERGDIEEAMNAASRIGDDALQRRAQGFVVPDSFTHGTSAQRMRWFETGLSAATIAACDTFSTQKL